MNRAEERARANRPWKPEEQDWKTLVNHMTPQQFGEWHMAGYPGLKEKDKSKLLPFVTNQK